MATPLTLKSGVGSGTQVGGAITISPGNSAGNHQAGANLTLNAGQGTGTNTGGDIVFNVATQGAAAATTNALATALTIYQSKAAQFKGDVFTTNVNVTGNFQLSGSTVSSTAAELNILDGGTTAGTTAVAGTDGIVVNDGGTMRQTTVDTFDTYLSATTKTLTNKTIDSANNTLTLDLSEGTLTGSTAEFNSALSDGSFATLAGTETLTNKTLTSAVLTTPQINDASADHKYTFNVSELVANRTVTLPLLSGDDTFVFKDHTETLTNKTLTAPKIANGGFIADANGNEQIKFTTTASAINELTIANADAGNSPSISASGGDTDIGITLTTKGSGAVTISNDLSLASDSAVLNFGANSEIKLTHVHDEGLALKHTATGDDKPIKLTLQTGETDIANNDIIGVIDFQAPDEGTGSDAILVCAGIEAVSEGDFAANNNATKLSFKTAASETASEKMKLSSAGVLTVNNTIESGVSSLTTGSLKFFSSGNTNTTTISAGANPTNSINYVLPEDAPPNNTNTYFLSSTSGGAMSWATNAGGGGGGLGTPVSSITLTDAATNGGTSIIIDADGTVPSTTSAIHNVGFGHTIFGSATNTLTTGKANTIMGYSVAPNISSASSNTLIGSFSGGSLSTGIRNTFIGSATGGTGGDTGTNNTCLGYGATVSASDVDNEITLGNNAVTDLRCADTTIASLSDARDKTDIIDLPWGLDFIDSLRPVQFTWDRRVLTPDDENWPMNGKKRAGFIAQDLQSSMTDNANEVLDLVYTSNPERLEVKQGKLVPILTQAIKELKAELDTLKAEVAALKNASN